MATYTFNMISMLMGRAMWLLVLLFVITRIEGFRKIFQKENY